MGLRLSIFMDNVKFQFNDICLASLRQFTHGNFIDSITYEVPTHPKREVDDAYIHFLETYTFYSRNAGMYGSSGTYWLKKKACNITAWFATITMLRYLDEAQQFLTFWYNKVYQEKLDPWLTFATMHYTGVGGLATPQPAYAINHNHALLPWSFEKLHNPIRVLAALRQDITGFDFKKLGMLHQTFATPIGGTFNWNDYYANPQNYKVDLPFEGMYPKVKEISEI